MPAESRIRVWLTTEDYVDLSYASARLAYSQSGERLRDRSGLIHRIVPGQNPQRYPVGLTLSILAEELLAACSAGSANDCVLAWLTALFRVQARVLVYLCGATLAIGGAPVARNLALVAYIEALPEEYSGTLPLIGGGPEYVELTFHVIEDGVFGDYESLSSFEAYTPARPA